MKARGVFFASRATAPGWCRFRLVTDSQVGSFVTKAHESRETGTLWALYIHGLGDFEPIEGHLAQLRAALVSSGLLPYVRGVCFREEWYELAHGGYIPRLKGLPIDRTVIEAIAGYCGIQHALIKDVFPELPILWLTTLAHPSMVYGEFYYRPVPMHVDALALDAYVPKGSTFEASVDPAYAAAIAMTSLPIVSIPQGFRTHDPADQWSAGPTVDHVAQYERWLRHPRVVSQWWFDWDSRAGFTGLDQMPAIQGAIAGYVAQGSALFSMAPTQERPVSRAAPITGVPASRTVGLRAE